MSGDIPLCDAKWELHDQSGRPPVPNNGSGEFIKLLQRLSLILAVISFISQMNEFLCSHVRPQNDTQKLESIFSSEEEKSRETV